MNTYTLYHIVVYLQRNNTRIVDPYLLVGMAAIRTPEPSGSYRVALAVSCTCVPVVSPYLKLYKKISTTQARFEWGDGWIYRRVPRQDGL